VTPGTGGGAGNSGPPAVRASPPGPGRILFPTVPSPPHRGGGSTAISTVTVTTATRVDNNTTAVARRA